MSEPIYSRAPGVVWRLGPDRVLVRRVDGAHRETLDVHGAAALVWISLDEPGTRTQLVERLGRAGLKAEPQEGLRPLLEMQLIVGEPPS